MAAIPSWAAPQLSPEHPELLAKVVQEAYQSGAHRIVIPVGIYRISPPVQGSHLQFEGLSDFEIDARGVSLILADQTRGGIEFRNCRNVRFLGARIAYAIPPFTQAVIAAIAPDGAWFDVHIEAGYPTNLDNGTYFSPNLMAHIFDAKSRMVKPKTYDLYAEKIQRTGAGRFRIYWNRPSGSGLHPVSVGDLIGIRGAGVHNVTVIECSHVDLTDVTIYNAGNFAIWESQGEGENHYSVTIKPGPRPNGATTDPLLSSTADAFHSTNMRKGPVLEDCDFEGMGDDGIAIHGTYSFVFSANGNRLIVNRSTFRPGDPLRLLDSSDRPAGEAVVESVRPLPDFVNTRKSERKTRQENTGGPYFELSLDRPLQAGFDDLASNPSASGSGYILRRNRISHHRARGMLLKADNGVVEDNTIDGSSMGGIVLSPEVWWNEASYSRNVVIRGNTIRNVAYAPEQLGALVIANTEMPVQVCGHQDIVIQSNIFQQFVGPNVYLSSACNVAVMDNRFIRANDENTVIRLIGVNGVHFESNQVAASNAKRDKLIEETASTQVEGIEEGIKVCAQNHCG
jgi:hypothetical protein